MPQMSPMLWSILFIMFILLFMFFNMLNYFNFNPTFKNKNENLNKCYNTNYLIWKW